MKPTTLRMFLYGWSLLFAVSCKQVGAEGLSVGASCTSDLDCSYRCLRGDDYPGGMCTMDCSTADDCPSNTTCIDDEGGVCAIECNSDGDCADHGDEWGCVAVDQLGKSGEARVCRVAGVNTGGAGGSPASAGGMGGSDGSGGSGGDES